MGRAEAAHYVSFCRKAGYTQGEAEVYIFLHGLYPYWLKDSSLEASIEKRAHDAWVTGIERYIAVEFQKPPALKVLPIEEIKMPLNLKAEERRRFVEAGERPSARARLAAIERAVERQAARDRVLSTTEKPGDVAKEALTATEKRTASLKERLALEAEFYEALEGMSMQPSQKVGHWADQFLQLVRSRRRLKKVQRTLKPQPNGAAHTDLLALLAAGRLDKSVVALALQPRFAPLFFEAERDEARRRLQRFPEFATRRPVEPADNFPETLSQNLPYRTDMVRIVIVNAYERDSGTRLACLAKYGYACAVCAMSFEEVYGPIGERFIHIHHKKPLHAVHEAYRLDPEYNLVPVCLNCHAMLHTSNPPLSVSELKVELERHQGGSAT